MQIYFQELILLKVGLNTCWTEWGMLKEGLWVKLKVSVENFDELKKTIILVEIKHVIEIDEIPIERISVLQISSPSLTLSIVLKFSLKGPLLLKQGLRHGPIIKNITRANFWLG